MVAATPQLLTNKDRGVLPVNGHSAGRDAPKGSKSKVVEGIKVTIRRLPPGMTEAEVKVILGDEWKMGGDKVDWFYFGPGKVAREYELRFEMLCILC